MCDNMNSPCHFSFYLHLSVIALKLSLQTFILPQIKILKYHWSKTYCIKPYHIMLITDMNSAYFPPPHPPTSFAGQISNQLIHMYQFHIKSKY